MMGDWLLLFLSFGMCKTEWIYLPLLTPRQGPNEKITFLEKNVSISNEKLCPPDFHNLTTMSYGTLFAERFRSRSDWEISYDDIEHLIRENEKLPKSSRELAEYVKQMGNSLMSEAEKRLKGVFIPSREARTKYIHFPSMESALLTIAMLLFGVYLSKLILKLLVSHSNRFNGGMMMTGIRTPITMQMGRRKRSIQLQNLNVMHLIDSYNPRFN